MSEADLLLLGDGIIPEVVPEVVAAAEQTLEAVNRRFSLGLRWERALIGGAALDAHGTPLPQALS